MKETVTYKETLYTIRWFIVKKWKEPASQTEVLSIVTEALSQTQDTADIAALYTLRWYVSNEWTKKESQDDAYDIVTELLDEEPTHLDFDGTPSNVIVNEPVEDTEFKDVGGKKVAFCVGHNKYTGARSHEGDDEWTTRNEVTKRAQKILQDKGVTAKIFYRDSSLGYGAAMRKHGKNIDAFGADIAIEIHFNSYNEQSNGMEMITTTKESGEVFKPFIQTFHKHYPDVVIRHGDGIVLRPSGRGSGFCRAPKCPAGVWEPCFASNPTEWNRFDDEYDKEAEALAESTLSSLSKL